MYVVHEGCIVHGRVSVLAAHAAHVIATGYLYPYTESSCMHVYSSTCSSTHHRDNCKALDDMLSRDAGLSEPIKVVGSPAYILGSSRGGSLATNGFTLFPN